MPEEEYNSIYPYSFTIKFYKEGYVIFTTLRGPRAFYFWDIKKIEIEKEFSDRTITIDGIERVNRTTDFSLFKCDENNWLIARKALIEIVNRMKIVGNTKFEIKNLYDTPRSTEETGGCYVATCVYGSYDCPQVWTLRRYRDETLGATWYGRAFIRTYYAISPTLVKWFGHTKWFKKMWKGKLDRMVKKLQDKGVENTPYADKDWRKK